MVLNLYCVILVVLNIGIFGGTLKTIKTFKRRAGVVLEVMSFMQDTLGASLIPWEQKNAF